MDLQTLTRSCNALGIKVPQEIVQRAKKVAQLQSVVQLLEMNLKTDVIVHRLNQQLGSQITTQTQLFGNFFTIRCPRQWDEYLMEAERQGLPLGNIIQKLRRSRRLVAAMQQMELEAPYPQMLAVEAQRLDDLTSWLRTLLKSRVSCSHALNLIDYYMDHNSDTSSSESEHD